MQNFTKQTPWPAVDDFLALRAAPSSNFRIQDDLSPSEAASASAELPDAEARAQVTVVMKAPMDSSQVQAATPSESPARPATAPNPPGWSADAIPTQEYAPMLPGGARAAMLIASPDNPQKPVVNLGSTVWSTIPPVPGQPATAAVKADADIPDLKMHASMTLRKNTDPTLQATHTIDLEFSFADGAPIAGFKDVGPPQMRKLDSTASDELTSVKIKVSDVFFLIGLAKGRYAIHNLNLIRTRAWFDFPLLLNDNRIAKLVFQKSSEGEAMLANAFETWNKAPLPTADELPQYNFAHAATKSPVVGGDADTRYFTIVYGMIGRTCTSRRRPRPSRGGAIVFTVDEGGNLVRRRVVTPSGSLNLDMAVMAAIGRPRLTRPRRIGGPDRCGSPTANENTNVGELQEEVRRAAPGKLNRSHSGFDGGRAGEIFSDPPGKPRTILEHQNSGEIF